MGFSLNPIKDKKKERCNIHYDAKDMERNF